MQSAHVQACLCTSGMPFSCSSQLLYTPPRYLNGSWTVQRSTPWDRVIICSTYSRRWDVIWSSISFVARWSREGVFSKLICWYVILLLIYMATFRYVTSKFQKLNNDHCCIARCCVVYVIVHPSSGDNNATKLGMLSIQRNQILECGFSYFHFNKLNTN